LNLEPIDENFDDFEESSERGGKRHETNEHPEAPKRA
jgi:hypothetical protein